jgi:hypothetical protein
MPAAKPPAFPTLGAYLGGLWSGGVGAGNQRVSIPQMLMPRGRPYLFTIQLARPRLSSYPGDDAGGRVAEGDEKSGLCSRDLAAEPPRRTHPAALDRVSAIHRHRPTASNSSRSRALHAASTSSRVRGIGVLLMSAPSFPRCGLRRRAALPPSRPPTPNTSHPHRGTPNTDRRAVTFRRRRLRARVRSPRRSRSD